MCESELMGLLSARERGGVCAPVFCRGAHKGLFGETRVKEQCESLCKKKTENKSSSPFYLPT